MFTNEKEILNRLNSNENLLNIIQSSDFNKDKDMIDHIPSTKEPDEIDPPVSELCSVDELIEYAIDSKKKGRPKGSKNYNNDERSDVALMGQVLGGYKGAVAMQVSTSQTSLYRRGIASHEGEEIPELKDSYKHKLGVVRDKVLNHLDDLMGIISEKELLHNISSAKEATIVASNLSNVLQRTLPQDTEEKPIAQFIIMQPQLKTVEQYEVIDV